MSADANQEQPETEVTETPEAQPDTQGSESPDRATDTGSHEEKQHSNDFVPRWRLNEEIQKRRELESRIAPPQAQPQPKAEDGKPKQEEFQTYEDYIDARARYEARQEYARARQEDQRQGQERSFQERIKKADESFDEKLFDASTKNPALMEKLRNAPTLRRDLQVFGLKESDAPIALAEHLADNPVLVLQLNQMPMERALRELGKIEAKLTGGAPAPTVSKLPKPMTPVGGNKSSGGGAMSLNKALDILYPS